jgi:hypothetical protein
MSFFADYLRQTASDGVKNIFQKGFDPVRATGDSANSIEVVVRDKGKAVFMEVLAEQPIEFILNGRGPGGIPPIYEVERWLSAKGLNLNPFAVAVNIAKYGTKRKYFGFFEDVESKLFPLMDKILTDTGIEDVLFHRLNELHKK